MQERVNSLMIDVCREENVSPEKIFHHNALEKSLH